MDVSLTVANVLASPVGFLTPPTSGTASHIDPAALFWDKLPQFYGFSGSIFAVLRDPALVRHGVESGRKTRKSCRN